MAIILHTGESVDSSLFSEVAHAVNDLWGGRMFSLITLFQWGNWVRNRCFHLTPRCRVLLHQKKLVISHPSSDQIPAIKPEVEKVAKACFRGFGADLELLNPITGEVVGRFQGVLVRRSSSEA